MRKELFRQAFHLLLGMLIASFVLLLGKTTALILVLMGIVFSLIISIYLIKSRKFLPVIDDVLEACEREHEKGIPLKAVHFFLLGCVIALMFPENIALTALLVLSIGDAASTLIGIKFGHIKLGKKSIEGAIGGTLFSSIPAFLALNSIPLALIASITGMLAELLIPIDDSITIPLSVGIILMMVI
ncbi:MAG: hypothetical protein JW703_00830 [Candidatus Diapherotrites archaeon]|nr:hypothetical protein [Candidatus Diapherotrites archaeon]